ncbi:MAG: hypothetical protein LBC30_01990, partial [Puniceicoccales bacterium]|nr:hypothetical protein [Puniceicoccales bacterium]
MFVDYPHGGNVTQEVNFNIRGGTYYRKFSFFAGLKLFKVKSFFVINNNVRERIQGSNNSAAELGINYNFLTIDKNRFDFSLSYYFVMDYEKSLHFIYLDEIYNKVNVGVSYNYDNDFFAGILYGKFLDSYRDSLAFNIEKFLVRSGYFSASIGYEHRRDIKTANDYVFDRKGTRYSLYGKLEDNLDEKNMVFLKTFLNFLNVGT